MTIQPRSFSFSVSYEQHKKCSPLEYRPPNPPFGNPKTPLSTVAQESASTKSVSTQRNSHPIGPNIYERVVLLSLVHQKALRKPLYEKLKEAIHRDVQCDGLNGIRGALALRHKFTELQGRILIEIMDAVATEYYTAAPATFGQLDVIIKRYKQLKAIVFQKKPVSNIDYLRLAFYMETIVCKIKNVQKTVLEKAVTGLKHVLQVDFKTKSCFVIASSEDSQFSQAGSAKEVTCALEVNLIRRDILPEIVICARLKKAESAAAFAAPTLKEAAFYEFFKGARGVIQLRSYCTYKEVTANSVVRGKRKEERPSLIFKKYDNDLLVIDEQSSFFNFDQKLGISEDLICGLAAIHGKGIIHGDMKLDNALYIRDSTGKVTAAICDFGHAFDLLKFEPETAAYQYGYYGSVFNTPPELFGRPNFGGSYFKTDVWALGIMLWEIHFGIVPKWTEVINTVHTTNFVDGAHKDKTLLKKAQSDILELIELEVLPKLSYFEREAALHPLTKKECLHQLIYMMLHPEPDKRITIFEAKEKIAQIIVMS